MLGAGSNVGSTYICTTSPAALTNASAPSDRHHPKLGVEMLALPPDKWPKFKSTRRRTVLQLFTTALVATPTLSLGRPMPVAPPGFRSLPSGLAYQVLHRVESGTKDVPDNDLSVRVLASGWLPSGEFFWRSEGPAEFSLARVIQGWREGIALMNPGDTFLFWIPAVLAYGERGRPPTIPPNSALLFKITLLSRSSRS